MPTFDCFIEVFIKFERNKKLHVFEILVDKCIDYNKENIYKEIMNFTNGKGVDLIIDQLSGYTINENMRASKVKGTIVVFPSFVWHRVTPVTSGTRYSLVNWLQGRPFV